MMEQAERISTGKNLCDEDALSIDESDQLSFTDGVSTYGGSKSETSKEPRSDISKTLSVVRILVITTLLAMAAIASNVTYILVLNKEEYSFDDHFHGYAEDIIENFLHRLEEQYWVADGISAEFTGYTADIGAKWPFTFLPDFLQRCADNRKISSASTIWFAPLVTESEREAWETYASQVFSSIQDSSFVDTYDPHQSGNLHVHNSSGPFMAYRETGRTVDQGIFRLEEGTAVTDDADFFFPIWQFATSDAILQSSSVVMYNQASESIRREALLQLMENKSAVMTKAFLQKTNESIHEFYASPTSSLYFPIFDNFGGQATVRGALTLEVDWESFFQSVLHGIDEPVVVVLENTCDQLFSFQVRGDTVEYLGEGDLHDDSVEGPSTNSSFQDFGDLQNLLVEETLDPPVEEHVLSETDLQHGAPFVPTETPCQYRVLVYPSVAMSERFITNKPLYYQGGIAMMFLFTTAVFVIYDCLVERRQKNTKDSANKTKAIVDSLFPKNVRDRLYANAEQGGKGVKSMLAMMHTPKIKLKSFLSEDITGEKGTSLQLLSEPIADLFTNSTVLFADIAGFTAWSSEREPSQVFTLLETLFGAMDKIAGKLKVFKVETVGDCYVAATGLPDPQPEHAVIMARFAHTAMRRVNELTQALEASLGPGTSELAIRCGMHSGPVTAGVLRGEKSRFQLFGDTMNTAARMESTGLPNRIQVSKDTADLLVEAGKTRWVELREDAVEVKGKGRMTTFWLIAVREKQSSQLTQVSYDPITGKNLEVGILAPESHKCNDHLDRLVDWNVDELFGILKKVVARRSATVAQASDSEAARRRSNSDTDDAEVGNRVAFDDVREIVTLPKFDPSLPGQTAEDAAVELSPIVRSELRDYVSQIAAGYRANAFHNFEHASHVCLSASKLLKRIVLSDDIDYRLDSNEGEASTIKAVAEDLHNHTYGISSDPLTHFTVVFSALVHDVGHTGVPNNQLAKEHPEIASKYSQQSIAEQLSVDLSWELLMTPCYDNLRACIFSTDQERTQFRELLVNSVIATDIFDPQMTALRKARWKKAFYMDANVSEDTLITPEEDMNRKATIVIEHIIQASDVAHTMQHWHIYGRWNERLFKEMYKAYQSGRAEKDPSEGWYKGELWFFDNYVIPLAKKLKECGVFGVSSDEYLNYAMANRVEWEQKGNEIVKNMVADCSKEIDDEEGVIFA